MQRWQTLLAQLKIINNGQEILSEEELLAFEAETGIILPVEYKKFCQVFGRGWFGNYFRIYCPTNSYLENFRKTINAIKEYGRVEDIQLTSSLLDRAFIFGDDAAAYAALWDLRTYSESDRSYNIYLISYPDFNGEIYPLGRDFWEFVQNFCLGTKYWEILPESISQSNESISHVFTRF